jgi:tetratricopeptide (TPR) repeat protein
VVETLQESIQTYPGQLSSYININSALQNLTQFEKALPYGRKAVELAPDDAIAAENLLVDLVALDRWPEAKQEIDRERRLGMDQTETIQTQVVYFFLQGDQAEVQKLMAQAAGRQDEFLVTQTLAGLQQFAGQFKLASATYQRAYDQAGHAKAPDVQANILSVDVNGRAFVGMCEGSEAKLEQATALDKTKQTQEFVAYTAAICGNGKMALPMIEALSKKFPEDTLIQDVFLPLSKAFVALAAGEAQQAIAGAEPAKAYDMGYPGSYVQGLAYLQLHDSGNAIRAFAAAMKYRGAAVSAGVGSPYAPAQLGLARAYAMAGDKANAKKAYEAFFLTWKDADADLPQLIAAKKEYAAL